MQIILLDSAFSTNSEYATSSLRFNMTGFKSSVFNLIIATLPETDFPTSDLIDHLVIANRGSRLWTISKLKYLNQTVLEKRP